MRFARQIHLASVPWDVLARQRNVPIWPDMRATNTAHPPHYNSATFASTWPTPSRDAYSFGLHETEDRLAWGRSDHADSVLRVGNYGGTGRCVESVTTSRIHPTWADLPREYRAAMLLCLRSSGGVNHRRDVRTRSSEDSS
jgi:hypothetical protein